MKKIFPFVDLQGQDNLKLAIILNLIDEKISGVLIRGEKGTGKSTAVRGIGELIQRCGGSKKVVELPMNSTEDRLVGSINIEKVLKEGEKVFQPGILYEADNNILYIDEINLLDDYLVDLILDAAAMGVNTVERDGISKIHSSKFTLVGTMNPEEGELRPQLLDRFGLMVEVYSEKDKDLRKNIVKKRLEFDSDPNAYIEKLKDKEAELYKKIIRARENFEEVEVSEEILNKVVETSIDLGVDGHRADITMIRAAKAYAAFLGFDKVDLDHIKTLLPMVYSHRLRKRPFEEINTDKIIAISESL